MCVLLLGVFTCAAVVRCSLICTVVCFGWEMFFVCVAGFGLVVVAVAVAVGVGFFVGGTAIVTFGLFGTKGMVVSYTVQSLCTEIPRFLPFCPTSRAQNCSNGSRDTSSRSRIE